MPSTRGIPAPRIARWTTKSGALQPGSRAAGSSKKSQPTQRGSRATSHAAASADSAGESRKYAGVPIARGAQSVRSRITSPGRIASPAA